MKVGLTYDLREDYLALGWDAQAVAEFDRPDTIDALEAALSGLGCDVDRIGNAERLVERLARGDRWDLVFNIAEGHTGSGREALVPALLDHYGIPATFADALTCATTLDKPTAKRLLRDHGLPTPDFAVVENAAGAAAVDLAPPLFVKPSREGSSKGVGPDSLVTSRQALRGACADLIERFHQPVLVERYLSGDEVTVGLVGTGPRAEVVGVLAVALKATAERGVYSYDNKERCEQLVEYTLAQGPRAEEAADLARRAYIALGCRDGGRVDLRTDESGAWSILELNPLPGLHPEHSDLPIMATLAGWSYGDLIGRILDSARERVGASTGTDAAAAGAAR